MEVLSPFTGFLKDAKRRTNVFSERPTKRARLETILQNLILDAEPVIHKRKFTESENVVASKRRFVEPLVVINRKRKFAEPVFNNVKRGRLDKRFFAAIKIQRVCKSWLARRRYIGRAAIKIQKIFRGWSVRSSFHIFKYAFYTC